MTDDWRSRLGPHAIRPLEEDSSLEVEIPRSKEFTPLVAFKWSVRWMFAGWFLMAALSLLAVAMADTGGASKGGTVLFLLFLFGIIGLPAYFYWRRSKIAWILWVVLSLIQIAMDIGKIVDGTTAHPAVSVSSISFTLIFMFLLFKAVPVIFNR